jgi:hypothetical protein
MFWLSSCSGAWRVVNRPPARTLTSAWCSRRNTYVIRGSPHEHGWNISHTLIWMCSFFQALPLYIRHRVLKEGQVLFVRDEDLLYEVAFRMVQAFEDFKPIYYRYLEQIAHVGP